MLIKIDVFKLVNIILYIKKLIDFIEQYVNGGCAQNDLNLNNKLLIAMTEKIPDKVNKPLLPVWARIVLIIVACVFLGGFSQFFGMLIIGIKPGDMGAIAQMSVPQQLVMQLFIFIAFFISVYIFRRFIDRRSINSMGFSLNRRVKDIMAGLIFPVVIIGGGSLLLYKLGYINFSNINVDVNNLLLNFCLFILVALNEEILFRGYILNNLMTSINKYWALFISALIFAVFHGLNNSISWLGFSNIVLAGILLGAAYIYTKNLWFAISFHLFWNFLQGPVLGYQVSGNKIESLTKIKTIGDKMFSGGEFGFEGSIICTVLSVVAILLIMWYYRRIKPAVDIIKN